METLLSKIITLIEHKMGKYKKPITLETALENDLGITGDDAVEFIIAYGKEFNVDVSKFMAADYFDAEGYDIVGPLIRWITRNKKPQKQLKILTLGHLEKGIIAGKLDEEVINS